jgi:hypothetical protein
MQRSAEGNFLRQQDLIEKHQPVSPFKPHFYNKRKKDKASKSHQGSFVGRSSYGGHRGKPKSSSYSTIQSGGYFPGGPQDRPQSQKIRSKKHSKYGKKFGG